MSAKAYLLEAALDIAEEAELFKVTDHPVPLMYIKEAYGICAAIDSYHRINHPNMSCIVRAQVRYLSELLYMNWPHFSGDATYPISGEVEFEDSDNLWVNHSGELRRSMLNHMIDKIRNGEC